MRIAIRQSLALTVPLIVLPAVLCADTGDRTESAGGKWRISVGARSRPVDVEFSTAAPPPSPQTLDPDRSGGATSLYNRQGRLEYEDGVIVFDPSFSPPIDPPFSIGDGTAQFGIDRSSQLGSRGGNRTVTFHSTVYQRQTDVDANPFIADESDTGVAPYIAVSRSVSGHFSLMARYAFWLADLTGQSSRDNSVTERWSRYSFTYDVDPSSASLPSAPFGPSDNRWLVFDAEDYRIRRPGVPVSAPTRSSSSTDGVVFSQEQATIELQTHELALTAQGRWQIGNAIGVCVSAGPTVSFVNWDFEHSTDWVLESTEETLEPYKDAESDQKILPGATAEIALDWTPGANGAFFVQTMAGYSWVDEVEATAGRGKAAINVGGFSAGIGAGINL